MDCICVVDNNGEWFCEEYNKPCKKIKRCGEFGDDMGCDDVSPIKTYKPLWVGGYDSKMKLIEYLKDWGIYFEPSACYDGYHFEILCNEIEYENIILFYNSII